MDFWQKFVDNSVVIVSEMIRNYSQKFAIIPNSRSPEISEICPLRYSPEFPEGFHRKSIHKCNIFFRIHQNSPEFLLWILEFRIFRSSVQKFITTLRKFNSKIPELGRNSIRNSSEYYPNYSFVFKFRDVCIIANFQLNPIAPFLGVSDFL